MTCKKCCGEKDRRCCYTPQQVKCMTVCNSIKITQLGDEVEEIKNKGCSSLLMGELPPDDYIGEKDSIYFCFSEASIWEKSDEWQRQGYFSMDGGEF